MKKKIVSLVLFGICLFGSNSMVFADPKSDAIAEAVRVQQEDAATNEPAREARTQEVLKEMEGQEASPTTVTVTEKIPGMNCPEKVSGDVTKRTYECTIEPGF
jgi:high-affinity K+ transport system ATPase subunit B